MTVATMTSCKTEAEKVDDSAEEVVDAQQNLDEAKADYEAQYNQFKLDTDERITANEKEIADLKVYSRDKKNEAKVEYDKMIADLESKNEAMKVRVREYKNEGSENWESFKREFNHDMDELGASLKDIGKNNVK
jgi:multidrug resistance efflux pump